MRSAFLPCSCSASRPTRTNRARGLRRRGRRPAGGARHQGSASRAPRDHRRLPVWLHLARPLRRRPGGRGDRQRRHARAAGQDGDLPRPRRSRRSRAERHDGRPRGRAPLAARRRGPQGPADRGLLRQVRVGVLRPVPRGGRLGAGLRRPAQLSDGSRQLRRGGARGAPRRGGGRRHGHGQAGAAVPRRDPPREGGDPGARGGLQRERRIRDGQGRGGGRLPRRGVDCARGPHRDQARAGPTS